MPLGIVSDFVLNLPRCLFGVLEDSVGVLLACHERVALVLETVRVEERVREDFRSRGRPRYSRKAMARAFVAKAILNVPTTKDLVERLRIDSRLRGVCGFGVRVPGEASFSRAFRSLARSGALDSALERAVKTHLGSEVVHHVSHDATAIPGRERTPRKPKQVKTKKGEKAKEKVKGPGRGGKRTKGQRPPPTVQELQEHRSWQESVDLLSTACDYGVKIGSQGYQTAWRGYKAHVSTADDGIPLAFFTTSASVSDGNVAIPLLKAVVERVGQVFYNLFDAAYQGQPIRRVCQSFDQVAIVAPKATKKGVPKVPLDPARFKRFASRSTVERFNSDLKENHGGKRIYVRGKVKVHAHLMCGVLAIFGLRLLRI